MIPTPTRTIPLGDDLVLTVSYTLEVRDDGRGFTEGKVELRLRRGGEPTAAAVRWPLHCTPALLDAVREVAEAGAHVALFAP